MIIVHHLNNSRSQRVLWLLEELDLEYEVRRYQRDPKTMLAPVIFFNLVLQTIDAFKAFTSAFIISGGTGGPIDSTLFYTLYLYEEGFGNFRMGYSSAMAWVLLIAIAAFTAAAFLTSKYWVFYEDDGKR